MNEIIIDKIPVLYGRDARKFLENMKKRKKLTKREKERIENNYNLIMSYTKGKLFDRII